MRSVVFLVLALFGVDSLSGQSITNLPPDAKNDRFYSDDLVSFRPALSLNGFSCERRGRCADGLGLAEVLIESYSLDGPSSTEEVFRKLIDLAEEPFDPVGSDRTGVIRNSKRLQARGLMALSRMVVDREFGWRQALPIDYRGTLQPVPADPQFLEALRAILDAPELVAPRRSLTDDAVKWTSAVTNLARAVDLYLALEIAATHYNQESTLLECSEKRDLLDLLGLAAEDVDEMGNIPIIAGIKRDDVQPGNWSMKTHVSVAYAALASQLEGDGACGDLHHREWDRWFERGLRSGGGPAERDRKWHWSYQTGAGDAFFAEGPYYMDFALADVLPFWHALRINDLLDAHPEFTLADPFRAPWLTRPLTWLADLNAPDGSTPPLDDGNRAPVTRTGLLSWDAAYGDEDIGRRFAYYRDLSPDVADSLRGRGGDDDLLLVELAIPGASQTLPPRQGLTEAGPLGEPHQLVVRHTTNQGLTHYVLLNGERGDAILRGEGHEQPDQLQLLYYVDDRSHLIDSGYDDAAGVSNSTWNHYADHNVLSLEDATNREGGVKPPRLNLFAGRLESTHPDVLILRGTSSGSVHTLRGRIPLHDDDDTAVAPVAHYDRYVVFVADIRNPYLIDMNVATSFSDSVRPALRYHGGSDVVGRDESLFTWESEFHPTTGLQVSVLLPVVGSPPPPGDGPDLVALVADRAREQYDTDQSIRHLRIDGPRLGDGEQFVYLSVLSADIPERPAFESVGDDTWLFRSAHQIDILSMAQETELLIDGQPVRLSRSGEAPAFLRLIRSGGRWGEARGFSANGTFDVSTAAEGSGRDDGPDGESGFIRPAVYPNPSEGTFRVSMPSHVRRIAVFDLLGREYATFNRPVREVTTASWPSGVYLFRFEMETGRVETVSVTLRGDQ